MNYLDFKLQNATTICADALKLRGFQVKENNGVIEFLSSSSKNDFFHVTRMLNRLDVPFVVKNESCLEILVTKLPRNFYTKVAKFGGEAYEIPFKDFHTKWRYFHNHPFGVRLDVLELEHNMAAFVKAANLAGIRVVSGCNGHLKNSPRFQVVGEYYGAWFEMIQQLYMSNLQLNYEWKMMYQGYTKAEIRASGTEWDMDLIHQDTMKMAEVLQKNAKEIRVLKEKLFKKHATEQKALVENKQYKELVQWMMQQYEEKVALYFSK